LRKIGWKATFLNLTDEASMRDILDLDRYPLDKPGTPPWERYIAVFSCYEKPGVIFSEEEQIGFHGRTA
jgi:hypothetical protein